MGLLTYLRNGKAYKLETWYTVYGGSSASSTCTVTSRLKPVGGCSNHHLLGHIVAPLQAAQLVFLSSIFCVLIVRLRLLERLTTISQRPLRSTSWVLTFSGALRLSATVKCKQAVRVATQYAPPLSSPWVPSASRAAEQPQRSSTFPCRTLFHTR